MRHYRKALVLSGLCIIAFFCGNFHYNNSLPDDGELNFNFYNDRGDTLFKGIIERDPEPGDKNIRLQVEVNAVFTDDEWRNISGKVLVFVPLYSDYKYGDFLLVRGTPETPPQFEDFDYETYLARKGIYSTLYYPEISVLDTGRGIEPMEWIYSFRNSIASVIDKTLPEPQASLTKGILLGMRSSIPQSTKDDFSHTGTAHLLAISGLHLSIIAGILIAVSIRIFGRKGYVYVWMTLAAIWIYAVLTGMNPPVLRSVQMISLFLAAELFGRQRSSIIALFFAVALMSAFNPRILWDPSFQLSFAAMAGLVFVFPPVQSFCRRIISSRLGESGVSSTIAAVITDTFSVSFSALAAVWPLIAYHFGIISPAGLLATFFALPALPGIIITGFLSGIIGLVFLPAAQIIVWLGWLFISYILVVVKVFTIIPAIENQSIGIIPVVIYYLILILALRFFYRRNNNVKAISLSAGLSSLIPKKWVIIPLLILVVLVSVFAFSTPDGKLHVCFLDVGQGDAILIQKDGRQVLIDGGPSPQALMTSLGSELPFWDRTIDLVVLTHPDADHMTGLLEVLNRYDVETVLYPGVNHSSALYSGFLELLSEKDIHVIKAEAGQRISFSNDIYLDVLNPLAGIRYSNIDNNSVVLRLESGNLSFLFTGDIMNEGEYGLIAHRAIVNSDVLKIAHHGSSSSTTNELLNLVNPEIAVISVGSDNRYGHPTQEVIERLESRVSTGIYRTDIHGTIEFISDSENTWVKTGNKK